MPGPRKRVAPKSPKVASAKAKIVKKSMERAAAKRDYNRAVGGPKIQKQPATQPKATPAISPRKVTSGGEGIGAAHQSFFDIGKFIKSLGGGK